MSRKITIEVFLKQQLICTNQAELSQKLSRQLIAKGKATQKNASKNKISIPKEVLDIDKKDTKTGRKKKEPIQKIQQQKELLNDSEQSSMVAAHYDDEKIDFENMEMEEKQFRMNNDDIDDEDDEEMDGYDFDKFQNIIEDGMDDSLDENQSQSDSFSNVGKYSNKINVDDSKLTKRQKTFYDKQNNSNFDQSLDLIQLPDRIQQRPRKKRNNLLDEDQQIKKIEQEKHRKEQVAKAIEEQKKLTVDKIINEAGRQQKKRKEQEAKNEDLKNKPKFRKLPEGEISIKYKSDKNGEKLYTDKSVIFFDYLNKIQAN